MAKNPKNAGALRGTVDAVVAAAAKRGISVTGEEMMSLVKTHAAGAAASMMAAGAIPGAGSAIALGIVNGFIWSMYYRICTKLKISIRKNVLKSLGSVLITELGAGIASELIAGTVLSFFPGIGSLGAAAVNGLMGYSITYYSGIVFMNLLVRVFKAGGSLEDMTVEEMKSVMSGVTKDVKFSDVKDEAKQGFKNRKNDGVATVIEDEDTPAAAVPTRPERTYWLHTGIDFGSTNSVMAWRLYKWSGEDGWQLDEQHNKDNNIVRCPTMLVFKRDNPDHSNVQSEPGDVIIGSHAEELANDPLEPAAARTNFKPVFYDAPAGSAGQKEAEELIGLFMKHLYELYQGDILASLPNEVQKDMCATVHISTPVRAGSTHRKRMAELAKRAGFVHDGKYNFIDTSRNEAECVMHLTVDANMSNMQRLMDISHGKSALTIMFVDVGGSTTDIEVIKQEMHSAGKSTQVLAMWPRGNVQYMLGGREVDRAIFDYLIAHQCLIPKYAEEAWEHGTGKTLFRKLKESNNENLRAGKPIAKLGTISSACGDPDEEEKPLNKYADYRITREVFENEICRRYINDLCAAMHEVLRGSGEDEVDAVFVTGAGSRLYFIHDLILGRYGDEPLGLTQLQQDESRLFDNYRDPATCCAEGAICGVM